MQVNSTALPWTKNWNSLAGETDQKNTKRQARKREKEKKIKLFLKLLSVSSQLPTYIKLASYLGT